MNQSDRVLGKGAAGSIGGYRVAESLACRFQQVRGVDLKRLLARFQIASSFYFFASSVCGYAAGSSRLVAINQLVDMVEATAGVKLRRRYKLDASQGVRGRSSDNTLIRERLRWAPSIALKHVSRRPTPGSTVG